MSRRANDPEEGGPTGQYLADRQTDRLTAAAALKLILILLISTGRLTSKIQLAVGGEYGGTHSCIGEPLDFKNADASLREAGGSDCGYRGNGEYTSPKFAICSRRERYFRRFPLHAETLC
jgi:hypothetical protein